MKKTKINKLIKSIIPSATILNRKYHIVVIDGGVHYYFYPSDFEEPHLNLTKTLLDIAKSHWVC